MAERTEASRHGMGTKEAIRTGSREWIPVHLRRAWKTWMLRVGLEDVTAVDLDTLASFFVLREGLRELVRTTGLVTAKDLTAFNAGQGRLQMLARSLRLTRQALDKKRMPESTPSKGGAGLEAGDLAVHRREGLPNEW